MKKLRINKILRKGKVFYLAYDQGMEHGPSDFNDKNINPEFIIEIARKCNFNGIVFQKGIAEKYFKEIKHSRVPLILKLNGKTNLRKGEPISRQLCTVKEAIELGAVAVGYTIYIGSEYESEMLTEFEKIEKEAHAKSLPVIAWIYPRGKSVEGKSEGELLAYAARVGLEIGADIVKLQWKGNVKELKWAVKSAGKTKVVIAGGLKKEEDALLEQVENAMKSGAVGVAIGRNVWQHPKPFKIAEKVRRVVFSVKYSEKHK